MARHVGASHAVLAFLLGGCLWPEPVNEDTPVDSAVTILTTSANPIGNQAIAQDDVCTLEVGLNTVYSPQGQPLFAQVWLNYWGYEGKTPLAINIGGATPIPLNLFASPSAGTTAIYQLLPQNLALLDYAADLNAATLGGTPSVVTVFVSDGFPDNQDPEQPESSSHTTAWYDWQVVVPLGSPCSTSLNMSSSFGQ